MEKDDQMDITDDVNITDESSEAQDLTMAGRTNVTCIGGKGSANTPPSSPPLSSSTANNGVSLLLNSALTTAAAAANGGSEAYQNSMLGILINKFGINGLQVRK